MLKELLLAAVLECSDLFDFLTDDEWIILPNLFSTQLTIIKGTIMGVTVPVKPTKHLSTTALEPCNAKSAEFVKLKQVELGEVLV